VSRRKAQGRSGCSGLLLFLKGKKSAARLDQTSQGALVPLSVRLFFRTLPVSFKENLAVGSGNL